MNAITATAPAAPPAAAPPGKMKLVEARVTISGREVGLISTLRLTPHGAGCNGLVALKIPSDLIHTQLLAMAASDFPDVGGTVHFPLVEWWKWSDGADDTVNQLESDYFDAVLADVFALPARDVRETALVLGQEVMRASLVHDLAEREAGNPLSVPASETTH